MAIQRTSFGGVLYFTEKGTEFLNLAEEIDPSGQAIAIKVTGNLRSDVRYDFSDEMMLCLAMKMDIVLDLENLQRISNACMTALLDIQQSVDQMGMGSLTLKHVPKPIYKALDSIGLTDLLMIAE